MSEKQHFYCSLSFKTIQGQLIYHAVLISAVQQSDSAIHIDTFFHILCHDGLPQDIEYSSLCSTVSSVQSLSRV